MPFKDFAQKINAQFNALQQQRDLFVVDVSGDDLFAEYLAAYPEGSNPLFRTRTEYDCTNCKQFIRNFGGVVAIDPESLAVTSIWGDTDVPYPYDVVTTHMQDFVRDQAITALFRVSQPSFSAERTVKLTEAGGTETYHHFHGVALARFVTREGAANGEFQTSVQVLTDSFEQLNPGAVQAVIDLINEKQLYRGQEHLSKVIAFQAAQNRYFSLDTAPLRARYVAATALDMAVSRFKNSVIGTLVAALAEGEDIEPAVRSFEAKVAPANYQRTSQVISQRMVDEALKTIDELGLHVERRMAHLDDISVNNVLWVNNETRPLMRDGLSALLAGAVATRPVQVQEKAITDVGIDAFLADVMPQAEAMRLLVAPDLANNFVTLTTAVKEGSPDLFKWSNPFAWSYTGGTTDQIQERVKAAGGNIKALLRFSLSWTNTDDLDLRLEYTGVTYQLFYFGRKESFLPGLRGGLDVDMNVHGETRTPVENIAFTQLLPGTYKVSVNNYTRRENRDVGFTLQVADGLGVTDYSYPLAVGNKQTIDCLTAVVDQQGNVTYQISPDLQAAATQVTGEKWGVPFGQFAEVRAVTLSPNYWDENASGNKHWFFLLKDALADEQPRGIYNEYLNSELSRHRRVFDVIGERTRPQITDNQLSGIGVSSTLHKAVVVEVTTPTSKRHYRVQF